MTLSTHKINSTAPVEYFKSSKTTHPLYVGVPFTYNFGNAGKVSFKNGDIIWASTILPSQATNAPSSAFDSSKAVAVADYGDGVVFRYGNGSGVIVAGFGKTWKNKVYLSNTNTTQTIKSITTPQYHSDNASSTPSTPANTIPQTNTSPQEKSVIPSILSSIGFLGGLYFAYTKKSKFWGYVGYGVLGSVTFGIVGQIGVKIFAPKSKDTAQGSGAGTLQTTTSNSNAVTAPKTTDDALNLVYKYISQTGQPTNVTGGSMTVSIQPIDQFKAQMKSILSDAEIMSLGRFVTIISNPSVVAAINKAFPDNPSTPKPTDAQMNSVLAQFGVSKADLDAGSAAFGKYMNASFKNTLSGK